MSNELQDAAYKDGYMRGRMESDGWQPIETAPKQKTVLLWALTDTETGNWKMDTGYWMPGYQNEPGVWIWEGSRLKTYSTQPTHWMPLPAPPSV